MKKLVFALVFGVISASYVFAAMAPVIDEEVTQEEKNALLRHAVQSDDTYNRVCGARLAIRAGANGVQVLKGDNTLLYIACLKNNHPVVRALLADEAVCDHVNSYNTEGMTPLSITCKQDTEKLFNLVFPYATNKTLNLQNRSLVTPLGHAVANRNPNIAHTLLDENKKRNITLDPEVLKNMKIVCQQKAGQMVVCFFNAGDEAMFERFENDGLESFLRAMKNEEFDKALGLLDSYYQGKGGVVRVPVADTTAPVISGDLSFINDLDRGLLFKQGTPEELLQACKDGRYDQVKRVMPGCTQESLALAQKYGKTFVRAACWGNHTEIVKWFMDHGAPIDEQLAATACIKNARRMDICDDIQLHNYDRAFKRALAWGFDDELNRMFKLYVLTKPKSKDEVKTEEISMALNVLIHDSTHEEIDHLYDSYCATTPLVLDGVDWVVIEAFAQERNKLVGFEKLKVCLQDAKQRQEVQATLKIAPKRVASYDYAAIAARLANKFIAPLVEKNNKRVQVDTFGKWKRFAEQREAGRMVAASGPGYSGASLMLK